MADLIEMAREHADKLGLSNVLYGEDGGLLTTKSKVVEALVSFAEKVLRRAIQAAEMSVDHRDCPLLRCHTLSAEAIRREFGL